MDFKILISKDALSDIQSAKKWYESKSIGLGKRFEKQTATQIDNLKNNPYILEIRYNNVRCVQVKKFPFLIHYFIEENIHTINIMAIFHTSRKPKIWKERRK